MKTMTMTLMKRKMSGDDSTSDQESADGNNVKRGQGIHTSSAAIIKVQHCLPHDVQLLFDVSKPFSLPYQLQYRANAIAQGILSFSWSEHYK